MSATGPTATGPTASDELRDLVGRGALDLALPGSGDTWARWAVLADLARRDPVLGRLAEAHTDAVAILAELDGPAVGAGQVWGVWAAEPPAPVLTASRTGDGWRLSGVKPWCSGAHSSTHALVTARTDDVRALFAVDLGRSGVRALPDTWPAVGMAGSDSGSVAFDDVPAVAVGAPGAYLERQGFWVGAIGVAAAWYGGACGVADALRQRTHPGAPHRDAHLGAVTAALAGARWALQHAARRVDEEPGSVGPATALAVRAIVEDAATTTLHRVGRALGAGPLCADGAHAARVADLTVYLRQSHAEDDLVALVAAETAGDPGAAW